MGTSRKRGVLGTGTSRKRGVLRTGLVKNTILVTDVAQKGFLGAYVLITLTFSCQHDQLVGVYSDRLTNRGLRHGSGQKGGSLLRHIPVLGIYVSAPTHRLPIYS